MNNRQLLLKGTLVLTLSGFLTKIMGFIYRIFLSQAIGARGMGIYQLIFPIQTLCFALSVG
ncbi:MAG: oligosaccharide flippase family protein, partial [Blautia sp.]